MAMNNIWIFCQVIVVFKISFLCRCNTHLPIEKGRWLGIPRHERVCRLCNAIQLGDEFHYLFSCPFFSRY